MIEADVAIIGGGPAGLSAVAHCLRLNLSVHLVTQYFGGKTNFRLKLPFLEADGFATGQEIVQRLREQIRVQQVPHNMGRVDHLEEDQGRLLLSGEGFEPVRSSAAILATGALPTRLDVPGEREFIMRGLAYSTAWYAPLFAGRTVAVVGTSARALRSASDMARVAHHVYLIGPTAAAVRRAGGPALDQTAGVTLLPDYKVDSLEGTDFVEQIFISKGSSTQCLDVDGVFVMEALEPKSSCVAGLVERTDDGFVKVDCRCRTSNPRIFAAGDVTHGLGEQVYIALGEGAKAAFSAYETLLSAPGGLSPAQARSTGRLGQRGPANGHK